MQGMEPPPRQGRGSGVDAALQRLYRLPPFL